MTEAPRPILLVGTADTKGAELAYMAAILRGHSVEIVVTGARSATFDVDVPAAAMGVTTSIFDERFENAFIKTMVSHRIYIVRPNKPTSEILFDDASYWIFDYDGEKLRLHNLEAKEYSEVNFAGDLNGLVDFMDDYATVY